jgi:hypothetical protein
MTIFPAAPPISPFHPNAMLRVLLLGARSRVAHPVLARRLGFAARALSSSNAKPGGGHTAGTSGKRQGVPRKPRNAKELTTILGDKTCSLHVRYALLLDPGEIISANALHLSALCYACGKEEQDPDSAKIFIETAKNWLPFEDGMGKDAQGAANILLAASKLVSKLASEHSLLQSLMDTAARFAPDMDAQQSANAFYALGKLNESGVRIEQKVISALSAAAVRTS